MNTPSLPRPASCLPPVRGTAHAGLALPALRPSWFDLDWAKKVPSLSASGLTVSPPGLTHRLYRADQGDTPLAHGSPGNALLGKTPHRRSSYIKIDLRRKAALRTFKKNPSSPLLLPRKGTRPSFLRSGRLEFITFYPRKGPERGSSLPGGVGPNSPTRGPVQRGPVRPESEARVRHDQQRPCLNPQLLKSPTPQIPCPSPNTRGGSSSKVLITGKSRMARVSPARPNRSMSTGCSPALLAPITSA